MYRSDYIQQPGRSEGVQMINFNKSASQTDMLLYEVRGRISIDRVRQMVGIHNNGIFANQVQGEAEGVHFARINVWKWSSIKGITENHLYFLVSKRDSGM